MALPYTVRYCTEVLFHVVRSSASRGWVLRLQNINDNGFTTRRATEQDLKRMLGVYFEQNVTTERFEDFDGDRWVIVGE